ncbi:MAG: hypothetical protein A2018_02165 [Alphaproteobacteria bacterium GWF2_58_20]|nr:MAG: hypothetical protein A2018_02165 [Alphaproteobacteria bacterium GWF2_58_20]
MMKTVLWIVASCLVALSAQAEWMSIGGGLGGGGNAPAQTAPEKPDKPSSGPSWFPGGGNSNPEPQQTAPSGSGSSGGSSWFPGGSGSSGNNSGTSGSGSSSGAEAGPEIVYTGIAHMDSRPATLRMRISGNQVAGTLEIGSICAQNIHLGGASITFTGALSGEWESKTGEINTTWQGKDHMCGTDVPNNGVFKVFLKDENTVHLRINGQRGQYGYDLKPHRKVYASGNAAVADSATGQPGKPDKPTKPDKPEAPVGSGELDPDDVDSIMALPSAMTLPPGGDMDFPVVFVVMSEDGEKRMVDDAAIKWTLGKGAEKKDGKIFISSKVADGEKITLVGRMTIGGKVFETKTVVTVREGEKLGTYNGRIMFDYSPFVSLKAGTHPVSPAWAEVELRHRLGSGGVFARTRTGADGQFTFRNVPRGFYQAWAVKMASTSFPDGYELEKPNGPWTHDWGDVPEMRWSEEADKQVETWDVAHKALSIRVAQPKDQGSMAGKLYGRVLRDGRGVTGVKVMADIDGGGSHRETTSGDDGVYVLDLSDVDSGRYWIRAEKYITKGWARCGDLLDIASNQKQAAHIISAPPDSLNGEQLDIPVATRGEIFGSCSDEDPVELPESGRFQGVKSRSLGEGW